MNNQNIDNDAYFKQCLMKYLNPADHHPATRAVKDFSK